MKVNPKVVCDKFEDEIVVVNLDSGIYYSLKNTAADLWALVEKNCSKEQVLNVFTTLTDSQKKEVNDFLDFLVEENLVDEIESNASFDERMTFRAIEYSKFEDMSDLIMLDPIHESDDQKGWPYEKKD